MELTNSQRILLALFSETRGGSTLDALRRAGNKRYTETVRQNSGRTIQTSNRTGTNEYNLSDTQGKEDGGLDTSAKPTEGEPIKRKKQDSNYWTSRLSTIN